MVPGSVPDSVECRWWNTLSSLEVFPDSSGLEALEPGGLDGIIVAECSVWGLFLGPVPLQCPFPQMEKNVCSADTGPPRLFR